MPLGELYECGIIMIGYFLQAFQTFSVMTLSLNTYTYSHIPMYVHVCMHVHTHKHVNRVFTIL